MDIGSITAITSLLSTSLGSVATAANLAEQVRGALKAGEIDGIEVRGLLGQVMDQILNAKEANLDLKEAVQTLGAEMRELDRFQTRAARYSLFQTAAGALVYKLNEGQENGEPPHYICPNCHEQRQISLLQPYSDTAKRCFACRVNFAFADSPKRPTRTNFARR